MTVTLAGCAAKRIVDGVYHSPKGYRIAIPSEAWVVVEGSRADLELRHHAAPVGMLASAVCRQESARRALNVLARQLLIGLRDRVMVEHGEVMLNGRPAAHAVIQGRMHDSAERVTAEVYIVKDERCVYDLVYVADPALFEAWRSEFRRFTQTFVAE